MQEASRGALSGVHGPVSKLIRVEDQYTTAIETALGAAMQNIVVDDDAFLGCHDTVFYVYADEIPAGWGKSWEQADFSAKTIKEAP